MLAFNDRLLTFKELEGIRKSSLKIEPSITDHNDKKNEEGDNTDTSDDNNDKNGESRKSTMVCRHARTKMLKYTAA